MTTLTCPKCRQGVTDDALDLGQCPACGFPFDGPLVLGAPGARSTGMRLLLALGFVALLAGAGVAVYAVAERAPHTPPAPEFAANTTPEPEVNVVHVAPMPHEPKRTDTSQPDPNPQPGGNVPDPEPLPFPVPPLVDPPKKDGPRPVGVVMKVDPKIAPTRHFDHPDDTAALPDLNTGDKVVLTGKLRVLRIGSVNGKGSVDASGLVAEEVVITGDLNSEAVVKLNAPGGKVTIGGFVGGSAKLTVSAPGGAVILAKSGRFTNSATVAIAAKHFEAAGVLGGSAKVSITFSAGGALKFTLLDEGATVTYRKTAPNDPAVAVDRGEVRGGAKLLAE